MTVRITNRYNDILTFNVNETEKSIILTGAKYIRSGFETKKKGFLPPIIVYNFIDPSGGPFIGIGENLGVFSKDLNGIIVKSIERGDGDDWILKY
jgi:hypothetical protein